jgi:hypothetical protein
MKKRAAILITAAALVAVGLISAVPGGASSPAPGTPGETAISEGQAVAIAQREAAAAGTSSPSQTTVSHGTLGEVMQSINPENAKVPASVYTDVPVTLVTMHGEFVLHKARVPHGAPAPSGTELAIVIENSTGEVVGRALPVEAPAIAGAAATGDATLTGRLRLGGGPHTVRPRYADRFDVVVSQGSRVLRTVKTNRHGSFALHLAAGTYSLAGRLASGRRCTAQTVRLRRNDRRFIEVACSIR